MTVEYLDLADYVRIASEITGLDEAVIVKISDLGLADSAFHAPSAEFGGEESYPDFVDRRRSSSSGSRRTIRCRTATSGWPGWSCATS